MANKLFPTNPSGVTVIRQVTPNICTLSSPFYRFGRVKIGARATLGKIKHNNDIRAVQILSWFCSPSAEW